MAETSGDKGVNDETSEQWVNKQLLAAHANLKKAGKPLDEWTTEECLDYLRSVVDFWDRNIKPLDETGK